MVLVLAVAILLGWQAKRMREQREAVEAVRKHGGWVHYDHEFVDGKPESSDGPRAPRWLVKLVGPEAFQSVRLVSLVYDDSTGKRFDNENQEPCDALLSKLAKLSGLKTLMLKGSQATDKGLESIGRMTDLEKLYIWQGVSVTDAGVAHLAHLKNLEYVHINGSKITDESLVLLSRLPKVRGLSLDGSRFTDAGLARMQGSDRLTDLAIGLGDLRLTDAGVANLSGFTNLTLIDLQGSDVTDAGLDRLKGLPKLKKLWLWNTRVSDDGVRRLKQANPAVFVSR
jgi:hypothetical protein